MERQLNSIRTQHPSEHGVKRICVLVSVIALGGCASRISEEVSSRYVSFSVPRNYQAVFRDLATYSKACYEIGLRAGHRSIGANAYADVQPVAALLSPDIGRGDIFVVVSKKRVIIPVLAISLVGSSEQARVTVTDLSPFEFVLALKSLRQTAEGHLSGC